MSDFERLSGPDGSRAVITSDSHGQVERISLWLLGDIAVEREPAAWFVRLCRVQHLRISIAAFQRECTRAGRKMDVLALCATLGSTAEWPDTLREQLLGHWVVQSPAVLFSADRDNLRITAGELTEIPRDLGPHVFLAFSKARSRCGEAVSRAYSEERERERKTPGASFYQLNQMAFYGGR